MTFIRKTTWRAWAMALFGTLLGMAAALVAARIVALRAQSEAARELQRAALDRARCEAHPTDWVVLTSGAAYIFAYDGRSLAAHHRHAPAYAGPARPRVGIVEVARPGVLGGPLGGAALVLRAAQAGPCAVLQLTWPSRIGRDAALSVGVSVMLIALASMGALGFFIVVRPLLRSIRAVSESAQHIGDPERYREPEALESEELDEIVTALSASNARLVAAEARSQHQMRALERHLAEVAHDFRTPLTALQLCIEEALDATSAPAAAALTTALQESLYLTSLTENLRLVARRRETGSYGTELWVLDLREIVERVASRLAIVARRKQMHFQTALGDEPVLVSAMPLAIERCLGNLVENAVVHGPLGGHVIVRLGTAEGRFELEVWNDVESSVAGACTELTHGARAGSGLGLRISREICAESSWDLQCSSAVPAGTHVIVRGPLADVTAALPG